MTLVSKSIPEAVCILGCRQVLRHCVFAVSAPRSTSPSAGHWPGWQQPWWNGVTVHHLGS